MRSHREELWFEVPSRRGSVNITETVLALTAGDLDLGPWEPGFYGEFDGRRRKRALVKIIGE